MRLPRAGTAASKAFARARRASSDKLQPRSAQAIRTALGDRTTTKPARPFVTAAGLLMLRHSFEIRGSNADPLQIQAPAPPPGLHSHQPGLPTHASVPRSDRGSPAISFRPTRLDPFLVHT